MDVLSGLLSTGRASRLYSRLVTEAGAATEVDTGQWSQQYGSVFLVLLTPAEGNTCEAVESLVHEELDRLATEGPTPEELERVKAQMRVGFLRSLESLQGRASRLNRYRVSPATPDSSQTTWPATKQWMVQPSRRRRHSCRPSVAPSFVCTPKPREVNSDHRTRPALRNRRCSVVRVSQVGHARWGDSPRRNANARQLPRSDACRSITRGRRRHPRWSPPWVVRSSGMCTGPTPWSVFASCCLAVCARPGRPPGTHRLCRRHGPSRRG